HSPRPLRSFPTRRSSDLRGLRDRAGSGRAIPRRTRYRTQAVPLTLLPVLPVPEITCARYIFTFVLAWELMSLASYFLVMTEADVDRKSTRLNSSHLVISY